MHTLHRAYAFTIEPQRNVADADFSAPPGGAVTLDDGLRRVLDGAFVTLGKKEMPQVSFDFDGKDDKRRNPVRQELMTIAFGAGAPASAGRLAARLSKEMDGRSPGALLVVAVRHDPDKSQDKREVSMLLLPREDVVQWNRPRGADILLKVLGDAFSTASGLRKVAVVEGHDDKSQFLNARILDLQFTRAEKNAADLWLRFLAASPSMTSDLGSKELVRALERAFSAASDEDRDSVFGAILKAKSGVVARTSLEKYAKELPHEVHAAFFSGLGSDGRKAIFVLDRAVVQNKLARRVFTGRDGVVVSAPSDAVGKSVKIKEGTTSRSVSYEGTIESDVVRGHGSRIGRSKITDQVQD